LNLLTSQVLQTNLTAEEGLEVEGEALRQDLDGTFKVDLIFVEASFLAGVCEPSLDSESELPAGLGAVDVLFEVLKQIDEAHLLGHEGSVVIEGRSIEEGLAATILDGLDHLVGTSEAFLGDDAGLHVVLISPLVPDLLLLVVLAQEVSADLVVEHAHHAALTVLAGQLNIHLAFASLGIMSHTGGCHLVLLEIDRDPLFDSQVLQVGRDVVVRLVLLELLPLSFEVLTLRFVLLQEAVEDLHSSLQVLAIRFIELLQELLGEGRVFVLELRVDFVPALDESVVALLQVLRQSVIEGLQLDPVLLGLLQGRVRYLGLVRVLLLLTLFLLVCLGHVLCGRVRLGRGRLQLLGLGALDHRRAEGVLHVLSVARCLVLTLLGLYIDFDLLRVGLVNLALGRFGVTDLLVQALNLLTLHSFFGLLFHLLVVLSDLLWVRGDLDLGRSSPVTFLRLQLLLFLLLFLTFLALRLFDFLRLHFLTFGVLIGLAIRHVIGRVFADVVDLILVASFLLLLSVPPVLTLTDESPVFVVHAIVAAEGRITSSPSDASLGHVSSCCPTSNSSYSEHAFIARIELLREHRLYVILKGHASIPQVHPLVTVLELDRILLRLILRFQGLTVTGLIAFVVFDHFGNVSKLILYKIL